MSSPDRMRETDRCRVLLVQGGPGGDDPAENRAALIALADAALHEEPADLVVYPELGTLPYFCVVSDLTLFDWAEPVGGPTTRAFARLARDHGVNVVVPLFERGPVSGVFYNSALLLNRAGRVVRGRLPSGEQVPAYRKVHVSSHFDYLPNINEKYYFRGGAGFPVFEMDSVRMGFLICYDRSFPESWRVLALSGAQLVVMISASYAGRRAESFVRELQTAAVQNGLFCVSVNKGGEESFRGQRMPFFGLSCAIDPFGEVLVQAPRDSGPHVLRVELDLHRLEAHGRRYHYMRDRRPNTYGSLLTEGAMDNPPEESLDYDDRD